MKTGITQEMAITALVNLHYSIRGEDCPREVAVGCATSAVQQLKRECEALREALSAMVELAEVDPTYNDATNEPDCYAALWAARGALESTGRHSVKREEDRMNAETGLVCMYCGIKQRFRDPFWQSGGKVRCEPCFFKEERPLAQITASTMKSSRNCSCETGTSWHDVTCPMFEDVHDEARCKDCDRRIPIDEKPVTDNGDRICQQCMSDRVAQSESRRMR